MPPLGIDGMAEEPIFAPKGAVDGHQGRRFQGSFMMRFLSEIGLKMTSRADRASARNFLSLSV
jgi:hypothetical protein